VGLSGIFKGLFFRGCPINYALGLNGKTTGIITSSYWAIMLAAIPNIL
jgi:hypothetical protein